MRSAWLEHVATTRKKGNRGKKTMTHREAMRAASLTWEKTKKKLERKINREKKKAYNRQTPSPAPAVENVLP